MRFLKQSTSVDLPIGPFLDDTDFKTTEGGLTLTQPDIRLKKNGAAWAQKNAAQTLTHEENGFYELTLDATDTNTLGLLRVAVLETGALIIWEDFMVMPAEAYDAMFGGTGVGLRADVRGWLGTTPATPTTAGVPEVDVTHVSGTAQTARDLGAQLDATVSSRSSQASVDTIDNLVDDLEARLTAGRATNLDNLDATISSRLAAASAPGNFSALSITAGGLVDITQAAADKVWGSAARTLTSLGASLVQEIWDRAVANLTTINSIGKLLVDNINAALSTIKAQTDKLTFNASNQVASNTKKMNDTDVIGTGQAGDKWRG